MKSLKFDHELAQQIVAGTKTTTWRINDDKDLHVDDKIVIIDKVDAKDKSSWQGIGLATINGIIEKRLGEIDLTDTGSHETYTSHEEMYEVFRRYYGANIGPETLVKIIDFSFKPYKEKQRIENIEDKNTTVITEVKLFADGGSRGNPGPSASGYVLLDMHDNILETNGEYLGITTNNQAEYHALRLGLEKALSMQIKIVHVYLDSLLVVNQMNGIYKVKNRDLWPIYTAIKETCAKFEQVRFSHVPRELNKLADSEVNRILDSVEK